MKLWRWIKSKRLKRFYLKQDVRVLKNELVYWDSGKHSWIPMIKGLPYSFGKLSVTLVTMTGESDLMYALFFRENPMDYFAKVVTHPVMVFYNSARGFWREDYHDMDALQRRIGTDNFMHLKTKAAIDWVNTVII